MNFQNSQLLNSKLDQFYTDMKNRKLVLKINKKKNLIRTNLLKTISTKLENSSKKSIQSTVVECAV